MRPKLMPLSGCWNKPEQRSKAWVIKTLNSSKYQKLTEMDYIMYGSQHDHSPDNIEFNIWCLDQILTLTHAKVLIVSKPQSCLVEMANHLIAIDSDRVEFMFTFGFYWESEWLQSIYEPDAPLMTTRFDVAQYIYQLGRFEISFIMEPLLEPSIINIGEMIAWFKSWKAKAIWIGLMQYNPQLAPQNIPIKAIYETYKDDPVIHFKDSFYTQAKKQGVVLP
jgi:hypothetical protein